MAWGHGTFQEAIYDWFNEYKVYLKAGANPLIARKDVNNDPELAKLGLEVSYFPPNNCIYASNCILLLNYV